MGDRRRLTAPEDAQGHTGGLSPPHNDPERPQQGRGPPAEHPILQPGNNNPAPPAAIERCQEALLNTSHLAALGVEAAR